MPSKSAARSGAKLPSAPRRSAPLTNKNATGLNALWHEWFVRGCKRTFSPFHRRVVTTNALEVGAAGEGDNRDHSFSAFRAERCSIHEDSSRFPLLTRNSNFLFHSCVTAEDRSAPWEPRSVGPIATQCLHVHQRLVADLGRRTLRECGCRKADRGENW